MSTDTDFMQRCFMLAELGRATCRPNPAVGCLVVTSRQQVFEGWHQVAGEAHAEIHALRQAGQAARGATVYVSLEPCAHHGRTGPCAAALVAAGVKKVVYGMQDPNPLVSGQGLAMLREAGIEVAGPVLEDQAREVNPGFDKRMRTGLPWVRLKLAMSLDGRTAMANGESRWITGPQAREDVHKLRARSCAILTGIGTVLKDDPRLDVRLPGYAGPQPLRVVVDSQARLPLSARVREGGGGLLQVLGSSAASDAVGSVVCAGPDGRVDLAALLRHLAADRHCNEVLVEAGPTLSGALLQAALVDEILIYMAPLLLGHEALPLMRLGGLEHLPQALQLRITDVRMLGKDCRIRTLPASGATSLNS